MRWLISTTLLVILLVNKIAAVAKQEKIIKKPLNLKPIKNTKSVLDEFQQHLAPEDAEFIKQIDKQFKEHGDKLKIKFERENSTKPVNKNQKRTIDDSLGYSYQQNMHQNGFYFSRPIYMHKFTPRDVLAEKGYGNEKATDIEVQQSHSYEIKGENFQFQPAESQQNYRQQQVYEDPVPVIVLRVPGPAKYALHLQALLQQYLELRAAQFLKVLEEQERHGLGTKQQQVPHHHQQQTQMAHYGPPAQEHQVAYVPMIALAPMYHQHHPHAYYQQQQQAHAYRHQVYHHQPIRHEATFMHIPVGEQSYYRQPQIHHPHHQIHHQQQQQQPQKTHFQNYPQPAYHNTQVQQPQHHHQTTTFVTYVTPAYSTSAAADEHHNEPLQTSENYPSDKHTHVIFKKKKTRVQNHPQPSITYHQAEPIVVADTPDHYSHNSDESDQQHHENVNAHITHQEYAVTHQPVYENQDESHSDNAHADHIVHVTERTKAPFNYHIAGPTLAPTPEELHERHNPKRMAPFSKEQFEKAKRIMDKSKRSRGSTKLEKISEKLDKKSSS
ncbi:hypothetical protein PVAND_010269 [Polypedilum vanderplanki]|uniref:Uncharacterized protein n=1 Tax=Polypedilum vanderplanki TaxID=319348 RepID=A0A9J6CFW3_POLVA|nr:hypothetical protein PVAND_010269 [Polypedilum vanderplanki]